MLNSKGQYSVREIQKASQECQADSLEGKSIENGLNQITQIQKFLERNYRDVNNLQSYLIKELQTIQNCKNRNQKVQKMIVQNIIPTFKEVRHQICNLKSIIPLLNSLATSYIQTVYQKSAALLLERQTQCKRYETQIQNLKRTIQELKEKQKHGIVSTTQQINHNMSEVKKERQVYLNRTPTQKLQLQDFPSFSQISFSQADKLSNICPRSNNNQAQEISAFRDTFNEEQTPKNKTGDKLNKYEEVYQNILKYKKVNISYKFEKSPIKASQESRSHSKSPYQAKATTIHRQEQALEERKHYIKQKIQKIKLKAECKQYQRNVTQKQRLR